MENTISSKDEFFKKYSSNSRKDLQNKKEVI